MEREAMMTKLLELLPEDQRPAMRQKIEDALAALPHGQIDHEATVASFLNDLGALAQWRGADFIYSRGIAETLRVGEDIFELAYAMKRAMG